MKVIVDTFPPTLLLDPDGRRGSLASVRWEVKDENLDLKSLVVEYQVEGVGVWRRVPIKRPKLIGGQQWDAGTAEAIKVRASVADKAGNVAEAAIELPEGTAGPSDLVTTDPGGDVPPGIAPVPDGTECRDHGRPWLHAGEPAPVRQTETNVGVRAIRPSNSCHHSTSRLDARRAVGWIGLGSRPGVARSRPVGSPVVDPPSTDLFPPAASARKLGCRRDRPTNPPAFTQSPVSRGRRRHVARRQPEIQASVCDR